MSNDENLKLLIDKYIAENNREAIISLCSSFRDARDRALFQNQCYIHQIKKLSESFKNITSAPAKPESKSSEPKFSSSLSKEQNPAPKSKTKPNFDLKL